MALIFALVAALVVLVVVTVWLKRTLTEPQAGAIIAKTLIFILALLFALGNGLCAFGTAITFQPVAILAVAALAMSVYACITLFKWRRSLAVSRIHPLAPFLAAILLTVAAFFVGIHTIRFAG